MSVTNFSLISSLELILPIFKISVYRATLYFEVVKVNFYNEKKYLTRSITRQEMSMTNFNLISALELILLNFF